MSDAGRASLLVDCRCTLGEGISWWAERHALLWTDIQARRLWMHDAGGARNWALPARLCCFARCESGTLLLGLDTGLFLADLGDSSGGTLSVTPLAAVEADLPTTRLNDGRTDRSGNFVFGTLNEAEGRAPIASFYQWSARHGLRRLDLPRVGISNSICFSPDGGTMYFCDTPQRRIQQCRYDAATAAVTDIRPFVTLDPSQGFPDGSVVDADGCLWNAAYGGAMVRRYRPDGTLEREIAVPAKNTTCPIFGGDSLNELFVTTARENMSPEDLARVPDAGGVYRALIADVRGLPDSLFRDGAGQ
jgi:sugar lactone lactonase YvrE